MFLDRLREKQSSKKSISSTRYLSKFKSVVEAVKKTSLAQCCGPKLMLLRLPKSFGAGSDSDNSFVTTFYHRFHIKK
jgi:hypothetical protein